LLHHPEELGLERPGQTTQYCDQDDDDEMHDPNRMVARARVAWDPFEKPVPTISGSISRFPQLAPTQPRALCAPRWQPWSFSSWW
jgi:hypothetical protein